MADFSPAAQAVYDAWITPARFPPPLSPSYAQKALAAALRAAADRVVPEYETTPGGTKIWPSEPVPSIRAEILAIAAELEGSSD